MSFISVVTPCYNEKGNVAQLYRRVQNLIPGSYGYEHIFIDNNSTDGTIEELRSMARHDGKVKVILNSRNYGHERSSFHGIMQASGDAVIHIVADLQEPPEVIPQFISKWEQGYKIVTGIRQNSTGITHDLYYRAFNFLPGFSGFGLYDREVLEILRQKCGPCPFFRGAIMQMGYEWAEVPYMQSCRYFGETKHNLFTLLSMAIRGVLDRYGVLFAANSPVIERERINFN